MHRSKLPEAEPHRLGCRVVLYYTSGSSHQRAAFWIRASHGKKTNDGESPDLVILEDILHSLNCFLSSGLDISDNTPRKRKLGRSWLLGFSSCYSTTTYPPNLNTSWGDLLQLPRNDSVPSPAETATQYNITQQPQGVCATCENKVRIVSLPCSHSFLVGGRV